MQRVLKVVTIDGDNVYVDIDMIVALSRSDDESTVIEFHEDDELVGVIANSNLGQVIIAIATIMDEDDDPASG